MTGLMTLASWLRIRSRPSSTLSPPGRTWGTRGAGSSFPYSMSEEALVVVPAGSGEPLVADAPVPHLKGNGYDTVAEARDAGDVAAELDQFHGQRDLLAGRAAPYCLASATVLGRDPTAMMRPAPRRAAAATAIRPTGLMPRTTTTSPTRISMFSTPVNPVATMSSTMTGGREPPARRRCPFHEVHGLS